eukprot:TRINITY_DN4849_c0_g1_i2.p2 TRINITY_DN4849_c0_g1~~TRINITY_DN4849_c0_g1_i2.p2  ORF type:complete len:101 (-),score=18.87 TRINITY_DN4849_c0_g1_i2:70-372(-)
MCIRDSNHTVEDSIYVDHEAIRCGAGKALLSRLIEDATAKGYREMMAVIGGSTNAGSIGLHSSLGFEMIGVAKRVGFKFGEYVDVAVSYTHLTLPTKRIV